METYVQQLKVTSENGRKQIMLREAVKTKAYLDDANIWTIGVGSTYYEDGSKVKKGDVITEAKALSLFATVLKKYETAVSDSVTSKITQNQFDALVSFCYNIGVKEFKNSTVLKKVNKDPNDSSIKESFLLWNKAGGKENKGLINRRNSEVKQYFQDNLPAKGFDFWSTPIIMSSRPGMCVKFPYFRYCDCFMCKPPYLFMNACVIGRGAY